MTDDNLICWLMRRHADAIAQAWQLGDLDGAKRIHTCRYMPLLGVRDLRRVWQMNA